MGLKRVIMIEDFAAVRGGATMIAVQTALAMRRAGLEVVYLCGDAGQNPQLTDAGVTVLGVGNGALLERPAHSALTSGLHDGASARQLRAWIEAHGGPDAIVHVHGYLQTLSPSVFQALSPMRGRIVLHAHDFFYVCPTGSYFNFTTGEKCALTPMGPACMTSHCDKRSRLQKLWRVARTARVQAGVRGLGDPPVIALHPGMLAILQAGGIAAHRIHVHRNPVTPWCEERVVAEANQGALFVGRLGFEKGPDLVARACAIAGAPLTVFGEGPLKDELRAIHPAVRIMGWGDRAAIAQEAKKARLFVLATRQIEAFGLTAFEAGLSGLPVVTPRNALVASELEQAGFGRAIDTNDVEALATWIRELSQDDARVSAKSHAGIAARATMAVTPDAYAQGLIRLYEQTLAGAPSLSNARGGGLE
jgi:glycosyltransferase involved in cell wall biosynthesis